MMNTLAQQHLVDLIQKYGELRVLCSQCRKEPPDHVSEGEDGVSILICSKCNFEVSTKKRKRPTSDYFPVSIVLLVQQINEECQPRYEFVSILTQDAEIKLHKFLTIHDLIAPLIKDSRKNVVKRLHELIALKKKVTGDETSSNNSIKFQMQELTNNYDIVQLRIKETELIKIVNEVSTYEDLPLVDDLQYWKLYKQEISELQASSIINLNDDNQINLALVFYVQSLQNTAYSIVEKERESELAIIKNAANFDRVETLNSVQKYVSDWLEQKKGTEAYFELLNLKEKIKLLQDELGKRQQSLSMNEVQSMLMSHEERLVEIQYLRGELEQVKHELREEQMKYRSIDERLRLLEIGRQKGSPVMTGYSTEAECEPQAE
ncbi:hypothetical protein FGO68_gene9245 [Halteria grandinella]|uniref:Uncharacterized protein n=1 Tax=Halteria grandinella TaxID=5974 RepID=A0A8J8SWC0_HALGN|nr:hypothetical protein FGO68_gene9245 [Halteria grandinella]